MPVEKFADFIGPQKFDLQSICKKPLFSFRDGTVDSNQKFRPAPAVEVGSYYPIIYRGFWNASQVMIAGFLNGQN